MEVSKKISIIFFGSPEFALPSLQTLFNSDRVEIKAVVSQPVKERGRGKNLKPTPVAEFALANNITLFEPVSLKKVDWSNLGPKENADPELIRFIDFLKVSGKPDFSIIVAYGKLIPEELIKLANYDFLNVHPSSLPRWRGSAPLQRTLIEGDEESSVCIMSLTKELDAGPVYKEEKFSIPLEENLKSLHDRTSSMGAKLLLETVLEIVDKKIKPVEQELEGLTYADKINPSDMAIDWNCNNLKIHNLIRGLSPTPGAFTKLSGKIVKIISSYPASEILIGETHKESSPGTIIINKKAKTLLVACGDGSTLEVLQLKPEGKGIINSSDFINGLKDINNLIFTS